MSHHAEEEEKNPLLSLIQTVFLAVISISLIVMLGFLGAAFLQGSGYKAPPPRAEATPVVAAAPPADGTTTPPVSPENAATVAKVDSPGTTTPAGTSASSGGDQMKLGEDTFKLMCTACHGPDGKGMGVEPAKMAPSFVGSELLLGNPEGPLAAVLKGIARKPDSKYIGQMMALGAGLDDEKVAAVITYLRNSFGNKASPVTVEQATAVRKKYANVSAPLGLPREALEKLPKEK